MDSGQYARNIGGPLLAESLRHYRDPDGDRCHPVAKRVLDRWALEEPNRVRLLCADPVKIEWLLDAAQDQGGVELELLTSMAAQRRRECGETDTDLLLEAGVALQMPDSLPFRHCDR